MTKKEKTGYVTSRRNLLRGTALAGAAALAGGATKVAAFPVRPPVPAAPKIEPGIIKAQANAIATAAPVDLSGYERVKQRLVAPPYAPKHEQVATGAPKIVEVEITIRERLMVVDEDTGASIWALTYDGSVPGPLIIVHQDDYVELTLKNPGNNLMEHNIDFHASTGALGGGGLTHVYPGEQTVLRWKATKPGVFTYHCAPGGAMIPYHVCHGMNGAVMVLPRDGLKDDAPLLFPETEYKYVGQLADSVRTRVRQLGIAAAPPSPHAALTVTIGMDPIHAGIMIVLALNISLMTPPVGACLFVLASVTGEKIERIARSLWPFLIAEVLILVLIAYWSDLTLFVPRLLGLVE